MNEEQAAPPPERSPSISSAPETSRTSETATPTATVVASGTRVEISRHDEPGPAGVVIRNCHSINDTEVFDYESGEFVPVEYPEVPEGEVLKEWGGECIGIMSASGPAMLTTMRTKIESTGLDPVRNFTHLYALEPGSDEPLFTATFENDRNEEAGFKGILAASPTKFAVEEGPYSECGEITVFDSSTFERAGSFGEWCSPAYFYGHFLPVSGDGWESATIDLENVRELPGAPLSSDQLTRGDCWLTIPSGSDLTPTKMLCPGHGETPFKVDEYFSEIVSASADHVLVRNGNDLAVVDAATGTYLFRITKDELNDLEANNHLLDGDGRLIIRKSNETIALSFPGATVETLATDEPLYMGSPVEGWSLYYSDVSASTVYLEKD
ncbi:hypothetical protein [Dietzia sp. UCD-THP]|uniref:hypothetical protein n=1 Tax=Dietzia sp. UCD-THP TaxID=1292020 RepID=UPI0012689FBB|nr:hypothetical protein [Dietzia sp. UCD-THP]